MDSKIRLDENANVPHHFGMWLNELLGGPIPSEKEAPCNDCVMCKSVQDFSPSEYRFNPETKCCTYFPNLPNFLVGKILLDNDPAFAQGRAAFLNIYAEAPVVITPLGVDAPYSIQQSYKGFHPEFGQLLEKRCPYYLTETGGSCGIWKYRNSKCTTWFCRYVRGQSGFEFWQSVDELLSAAQKGIARWCMRQLDVGSAELQQMFLAPDISAPTPENLITAFRREVFRSVTGLLSKMQDKHALSQLQQETWGRWLGREIEYFEECSRLVDSLHWNDVINIVGGKIEAFAEKTCQRYRSLTHENIPATLRVNSITRINLDEHRCRVWCYNRYHPLDLSRKIADALPYFDGSGTEQILQRIHTEQGLTIDSKTLQKLYDHRILVEAA